MDQHLIAYYIGILIIFTSHIYLLLKDGMDMKTHSYMNIFAAILIAYYFMNKENMIKF